MVQECNEGKDPKSTGETAASGHQLQTRRGTLASLRGVSQKTAHGLGCSEHQYLSAGEPWDSKPKTEPLLLSLWQHKPGLSWAPPSSVRQDPRLLRTVLGAHSGMEAGITWSEQCTCTSFSTAPLGTVKILEDYLKSSRWPWKKGTLLSGFPAPST